MAAGVLSAYLFRDVPPVSIIVATAAIAAMVLPFRKCRLPGLFVLSCCWALWHCAQRLDDRLDPALDGVSLAAAGVVASVPQEHPEYIRFQFRPDGNQPGCCEPGVLPSRILVYWYRDRPDVSAGERWRLQLDLRPPRGRVNFQGADRERWLFAEGIGAVASAKGGRRLQAAGEGGFFLQRVREKVREGILRAVPDDRPRGVILAIAIADRSGISTRDRRLLSATGTGHLLAISGLHVGLAAAAGFWTTRLLLMAVPTARRGAGNLRVAWLGGLVVASAYAALAAFGVSTVRAVLMLGVAVCVLASRRNVHPGAAWVLALAGVLLVNPLAPLNAGFWFSFAAVAALLLMYIPRRTNRSWLPSLALAQLAITVCLAPLAMYWFQTTAPLGLAANLVAIPWVSLVIVPLTLLAVASMPLSALLSAQVFSAAGLASSGLLAVLGALGSLQETQPVFPPPSAAAAMMAGLGGCLMLLPGGFPHRWMGLLLLVPLYLPRLPAVGPGELQVEVLDVGQGLSLTVRTRNRALLYDSGPGDGRDWSLVGPVIAPALAAAGDGAPDRILVSHGDLDHAGGLGQLTARYPHSPIYANLPGDGAETPGCRDALRWSWDGFAFDVLHPSAYLPYVGNDSSCVLSIRSRHVSALLTGDISRAVEQRLIRDRIGAHALLLVPHHGSATSSGADFIAEVSPELAIASNAKGNRFGFPRPEVRDRYLESGAEFLSTGECGALRVRMSPGGEVSAESARRERNRIWRWPAGDDCP